MVRTRDTFRLPQLSVRDRERDLGSGVVKSARRVFELFELFEQINRPATVSEIVQATGFPQSSTSMLLQTLHRMGYLCWNPDDRTYVPSLRLNMLGGWVHDIALPRSNLRLAMQELSRRTGVSVVLGQRMGRFVQYAHVVFASSSRDDDVPIGVVRPLVETGLGYSLMAALPDEEVRRVATACLLPQMQASVVRSVEQVREMVEQVRRTGFAYSTRLQNAGRASFSFGLGRSGGRDSDFSRESSLLGLALAGKRHVLEARLPEIITAVNDVVRECLPDVQIEIDPTTPIHTI